MRDFRDAKAMAQTLREALKAKSISLTHSESLELVAKSLGFHDWNELSAKIQSESSAAQPPTVIPPTTKPATQADLPVVALRDLVIFPHMVAPLFVGRETTRRALEQAMAGDKRILAVTQRNPGDDNPGRDELYGVGAIATVVDFINLWDGTIKLLVRGLRRAAIVHLVESPFLAAAIAPVEESRSKDEEAMALSRVALERLKSHVGFLASPFDRLAHVEQANPGIFADSLAPLLSAEIKQKQEILEAGDVVVRLQKVLALMKTDQQAA